MSLCDNTGSLESIVTTSDKDLSSTSRLPSLNVADAWILCKHPFQLSEVLQNVKRKAEDRFREGMCS
jgi:hypothetical protein